jgi:hypothetical protein
LTFKPTTDLLKSGDFFDSFFTTVTFITKNPAAVFWALIAREARLLYGTW